MNYRILFPQVNELEKCGNIKIKRENKTGPFVGSKSFDWAIRCFPLKLFEAFCLRTLNKISVFKTSFMTFPITKKCHIIFC